MLYCDYPVAHLEALDGEGRCLITDLGALLLVNVYGPCVSGPERVEERQGFKLDFFKVGGRGAGRVQGAGSDGSKDTRGTI